MGRFVTKLIRMSVRMGGVRESDYEAFPSEG
jgi:hypothetical protein